MKHFNVICFAATIALSFTSNTGKEKPGIGISTSMENDSIVTAAGFSCIIESTGRLSPLKVSDSAFRKSVPRYQSLNRPVLAFNVFLPGELKVVGPEINEKAVLQYAEEVLRRTSQTGTKMIVWGSGGSRRIPVGFSKETATRQFVDMAQKIAGIAAKYGVVLALENLNSGETNFINTVSEALEIVKRVNHPNFRLNADIYHMLKEGEAPKIIRKTKGYLVHVEIAEKEKRTAPGVMGTDFRPYLRELRRINYHQKIVIEGSWTNLSDIAASSRDYLQAQIDAVW